MTKNNQAINNTGNPDNKAKLLMIGTIIFCLALFLWVSYSFYGFWGNWKSVPQNNGADSYIDTAGLNEVKSILEGRK